MDTEHPGTPPGSVARLLQERLGGRIATAFFTHSAHVPLFVFIVEALYSGAAVLTEIDAWFLLLAGLLQAVYSGWLAGRGQYQPWRGNLLGPALYSLVEALLEGLAFFSQPQHLAYWGFSLAFAGVQSAQRRWPHGVAPLLVLENMVRAAIPLVMYALVEAQLEGKAVHWQAFMADPSHRFLAVAVLLLGVLLGLAALTARRSQLALQALAGRLGEYSAWSLGEQLLAQAIGDERALALNRRQRAVLFLDVRGFTAWSEAQPPETVVALLNACYREAEACLLPLAPVKVKYTADEVLAVFATPAQALAAGRALLAHLHEAGGALAGAGLGAGIGIHAGPVVEGVLGGQAARAYDVIGDTVNTAQRLCSAAAAGELLYSAAILPAAEQSPARLLQVKGKARPLPVWVERQGGMLPAAGGDDADEEEGRDAPVTGGR